MVKHKGTQVIQSKRLILRKITSDDLEMIYSWMSDPELTKYEDWSMFSKTAHVIYIFLWECLL